MGHRPEASRTDTESKRQAKPDTKAPNGSITIKIQLRTYELLHRIIDLEAEQMMTATGGGGCDGCVEEFRKRISMTEIIHRAVRMLAKGKGLKL